MVGPNNVIGTVGHRRHTESNPDLDTRLNLFPYILLKIARNIMEII